MLKKIFLLFVIAAICLLNVTPVLASNTAVVTILGIPIYSGGILTFNVIYVSDTEMDLNWTVGAGVENVMVRAKYGTPPANPLDINTAPSDGYLVYYGSNLSAVDTSMDMNQNGGTLYYTAWAQKLDGTWNLISSSKSEESKEMILIFLGFVTLTLTGFGVLGKKPFLDWASVPFWLITCIYIYMNYTWLAEAQWLFLLIGFGMSAGMVFEAILTQRKESLANIKEDESLMNEDEENWTDEDVDNEGKEFKLTKVQKRYS